MSTRFPFPIPSGWFAVLCDGDGAIARFRSWASQFHAGQPAPAPQ